MSDSNLHGRAGELRRRGDFGAAGDEYTLRAYQQLGNVSLEGALGPLGSLYYLFYAAGCYRLANAMGRCRNRCEQGFLIVEDLRENIAPRGQPDFENAVPAYTGIAHEYAADFRLLGDLGGHDDRYEQAFEQYEIVEAASNLSQIIAWNHEPGFHETIQYVLFGTAEAVGEPVPEPIKKDMTLSLTGRIEYKRRRFPELLDSLFEQESWIWENDDGD